MLQSEKTGKRDFGRFEMTQKHLMISGAVFGIFVFVLAFIFPPSGAQVLVILAFACGMLFGKGYGIFEEREKK